MVTARMAGDHRLLDLMISPSLTGEDEDMLADLVVAAINDCVRKLEEVMKGKMMSLAKDMKLPEGFNGDAGGDATGGSTGIQ